MQLRPTNEVLSTRREAIDLGPETVFRGPFVPYVQNIFGMQIPNLIQDCHTIAIRPRNYAPQFESLWVPLESAISKEPQTLEEVYVCVCVGGAFPVTPPEFKVKPSTLSQ